MELPRMEKFEIFSWIVPGFVVTLSVAWKYRASLQTYPDFLLGFMLLAGVLIGGYIIYCLGFLVDGCFLRNKLSGVDEPKDLHKICVRKEFSYILDIIAEDALYFNMGVAFLISMVIIKSLKLLPLSFLSFSGYVVWVKCYYPKYYEMAREELEKKKN